MFSQPMSSPVILDLILLYLGETLKTLEASSETVFAITAPHPSRKARRITARLVPGGPLPMTKGLGRRRPEGCGHERSGPSRLRPEFGSRRVGVADAEGAEAAVVKVEREVGARLREGS